MRGFLQIAKIVQWPNGSEPRAKFLVVETVITHDGPLTRLCHGQFETEEAARADIDAREEDFK